MNKSILHFWFPLIKDCKTFPTRLYINNFYTNFTPEILYKIIISSTLITGIILILTGFMLNALFLSFLGISTWLLLPRVISFFFRLKMEVEKQQYDIDALFTLNEILIISNTTGSEVQSLFILSKSNNKYLRYIAKKAFIVKSTSIPINSLAIVNGFSELWDRPSTRAFIQFFNNWNQNLGSRKNSKLHQNLIMNQIQTQLKVDEKILDNWTTSITAFLGIGPIGLFFITLFSNNLPQYTIEILLIVFILTILIFNFLDPYRIRDMAIYSGNLDQKQNVDGILIVDALVKSLQRNPNFFTGIREIIKLFPSNQKIRVLDNTLACGIDIAMKEVLENLKQFMYGKEKIFLQMALEWSKIDVHSAVEQLTELMKSLSFLEFENHRKKGILLGEKRKLSLLLSLSAFSFGLLTILSPIFLKINNLTQIQKKFIYITGVFDFSISLFFIIEIWFFILIIIGNYVSVFQLRNWNKIIITIALLTFIYILGLLFAWILTEPTLIL